jgi:hypothetical protein
LPEGEGLSLSQNPKMGKPIGIFGSTKDQNQVELFGAITGVGASIVEVSADFKEKHSGCPALNSEKEVVGIASFVRESANHNMKKGTRFENSTRHFCYRIERAQWKTVNWKRFNEEYGSIYQEANTFIDDIIKILNRWADDPFDRVTFEEEPERNLTDWIGSHVIRGYGGKNSFNRKFYGEYSESARKLSDLCNSRARRIRMMAKQRGLTDFLIKEFDMQAGSLEYFAKIIDRYATTTDY